ncbi:MAG: radical SAM protein [Oligoflexia bacterium]|nr:radical SAM protein [Oligoflexia bacterium]
MKKKVIIVEPLGSPANVFKRFMFLPLMGPIYLGTILKAAGFEVVVYNENIMHMGRQSPSRLVDSQEFDLSILMSKNLQADFLLLSLLTVSVERGHAIAKVFRKLNPHGKIIIGGVHPTLLPEESLEFADWVVQGEGEEVIVDLLKYGSSEKKIVTKHIEDLNKIPTPDFSLLSHSSNLPLNKLMSIYPLITSRGCPFDCSFCSVTKTFGRKFREVDNQKVIEEISRVQQPNIFFYDDNFTANKKRIKSLLEQMIAQNIKKSWSSQNRIDIANDDELLELMKRSGCTRVHLGIESINDQVLNNIHKSQTTEQIEMSIKKIHSVGISIHAMFIFGHDFDTPNVFKETIDFCRRNKIGSLQFLALTPFPGTETYEKMEKEKRILHKRWRYYDALHVVFRPKNISASALQQNIISSFDEYYSWSRLVTTAKELFWAIPQTIYQAVYLKRLHYRIENFLHNLLARGIIREWRKLNAHYLNFLNQMFKN